MEQPGASVRTADPLMVGDLVVDVTEPHVVVAGTDVWLSRRDWQVLLVLARAGGHVVTRDELYREVWGQPVGDRRDRSADVYIRRLRKRLGQADPGRIHIHTQHNVGYRLSPQSTAKGEP